ncbi:MAG TPA: hypothetical protein VNB22_01490 [Pyrinomonadaceae bacterium]|jgi:hypothetical protein|nr:hypothetical protein [Pyrinomonadaceae bacterium]
MKINKFAILMFVLFALFFVSCTKSSLKSAPSVEYAQVCTPANKDKEVTVQGFLNVTDKVPCVKILNIKRDCAFKFMDKVNVAGTEIMVYLPEGTDKNQAETPDAQKGYGETKPSAVFTRDEVKFRLDDGSLIVPQKDIATPVTVTGKVSLSDGGDKLCAIMAARVEKRP